MKSIRLAIVLLLASIAVSSPARAEPLTLIGRLGLSIASITSDNDLFSPKTREALAGALALAVPLANGFALSPELGYSQRGFSYGTSVLTDPSGNWLGTFETVRRFDVATIAVPVHYRGRIAGSVSGALLAGPEFSFEISERVTSAGAASFAYEDDALMETSFNAAFGAALDVPVGGWRLGLEGRFILGVYPVNELPLPEGRSKSTELSLFLGIPLGH